MSSKWHLFLLLFARFTGFFLISPLFSGRSIPKTIRFGLALTCSLLIAPPLSNRFGFTLDDPLLLSIRMLQELAIGYLLGLFFSLLFEAAAFAGQMVGTLMGFSATELLDPLSSSSHPLMARFLSLVMFTLFLALDLHHTLLRLLYENFEILPLQNYPFNFDTVFKLINASSQMFQQALEFASLPLLILLSLIALFALLSRFLPIFWIGFPLQLLVGLIALTSGSVFFAPLLKRAFSHFLTLFQS